jgi:hypothetical protein
VVSVCTSRFNTKTCAFCPHSVFKLYAACDSQNKQPFSPIQHSPIDLPNGSTLFSLWGTNFVLYIVYKAMLWRLFIRIEGAGDGGFVVCARCLWVSWCTERAGKIVYGLWAVLEPQRSVWVTVCVVWVERFRRLYRSSTTKKKSILHVPAEKNVWFGSDIPQRVHDADTLHRDTVVEKNNKMGTCSPRWH